MRKIIFSLSALCLIGFSAKAQEAKEVAGFKISGYVDGYYQTKFTNNDEDVVNRSFMSKAESFELGNVNVTLEKEFGKAGFVGQLGFGPRADAANGETPQIQQLYAYYNFNDKLKATFGTFGTFVGYEVIDAPANFHYSTSLLFQNGPFFHTGLKFDYDFGNGLTAMAGVFNTTDSQTDVDARTLHFGGQIGYSTDDDMNVFANFIYGDTDGADTNVGQGDIVIDKTFDKNYVALNASYQFQNPDGAENSTEWFGVALYLQREINEKLGLGLRTEFFDDADAAAGVLAGGTEDGNIIGLTLSAPYKVDGLQFIPEIRYDIASDDVFINGDGEAKGAQLTLGAGVVYSF